MNRFILVIFFISQFSYGQTEILYSLIDQSINLANTKLGSNNYQLTNTINSEESDFYYYLNNSDEDVFFAYWKGQTPYIVANHELMVEVSKRTNKIVLIDYKAVISRECSGDCLSSFLSRVKNKVDYSIKPLPKKRSDRKNYTPPVSVKSFNSNIGRIEQYRWDYKDRVLLLSSNNNSAEIKPSRTKLVNKFNFINYMIGKPKDLMISVEAFNPLKDYDIYSIPYDDAEDYVELFLMDIIYNVYDKKDDIKSKVNSFNRRVYFEDIKEFDDKPDYHTVAIARKMFDDCGLEIQIDINNWINSAPLKRIWIIYHELSHDLFNIEHNQGGDIMLPYLPGKITESLFQSERRKLIKYLKLLNYKPDCDVLDSFVN